MFKRSSEKTDYKCLMRFEVDFQTTSMLTASNIVKEQIVQTTSKKVLRSSEL